METKKIPFEEIYDIYAVRVIFENDDDTLERIHCWEIYTFFTDGHKVHRNASATGQAPRRQTVIVPFTSLRWNYLTANGSKCR